MRHGQPRNFTMSLARRLIAGLLLALPVLPVQAGNMTISYTHTDVQGNVIAVTDENQTVTERREYEPYGLPQTPIIDDTGFTGHLHDGDTGLVYMQQRYYDAMTGQFLSADPVGVSASTGANFNRYTYANNNPYKYTDPDGRLPCHLLGDRCGSDGQLIEGSGSQEFAERVAGTGSSNSAEEDNKNGEGDESEDGTSVDVAMLTTLVASLSTSTITLGGEEASMASAAAREIPAESAMSSRSIRVSSIATGAAGVLTAVSIYGEFFEQRNGRQTSMETNIDVGMHLVGLAGFPGLATSGGYFVTKGVLIPEFRRAQLKDNIYSIDDFNREFIRRVLRTDTSKLPE